MANEIPISVVDRKIKVGRHVPATMTNIGKDYLSISLDNEWSITNHRLRVTLYSDAPYVSVQNWWDGKSAIEIPQEITSCPAFKVTVALISENGYERLVTQAMDEPIENPRNGHDEGAEPGARTMDIIVRIDNLAADLEHKRDTDYWRGEPGKDGAPGAPGAPGEPGADGYSPTANVTKNGGTATITVTDKNGTTTATVSDGAPGKDGSDAAATDVRINGTSVTVDGVANIPATKGNSNNATENSYGVVKSRGQAYGIWVEPGGSICTNAVNKSDIDRRDNYFKPITSAWVDYAVKAAMCDGKGAAWTDNEQQAARERMNAADANKVYIMQKQIANLQGIAATEETDSTEAYTKTVPTGAQKWASLDKVGGKTVVWNKLVPNVVVRSDATNGLTVTIYNNNGRFHVVGTPTVLNANIIGFPYEEDVIAGHEYMVVESKLLSGTSTAVETSITGVSSAFGGYGVSPIGSAAIRTARDSKKVGVNLQFIFSDTTTAVDAWYEYPIIIDLTQLFGAGNEPTSIDDPRIAFIKAYAAAHPEYNPGELMSAEVVEVESKGTFPIQQYVRDMCPGYGWSAGTVCNEIDFERKVYVQRVGSVDMGTLNWEYSKSIERYNASDLFGAKGKPRPSELSNMSCAKLLPTTIDAISVVGSPDGVAINDSGRVRASYSALSDAAAFKAAMQGVILYYELATPIEVALSNVLPDDHFIEVEAGGTVTFKQASTQLPVPSSVTYQISTKEVVANA